MKNKTIEKLPNISANAVVKFLKLRGFNLDIDFRNARLGKLYKGFKKLSFNGNYTVVIACCADNGHTWVCKAVNSIPNGTQYILECHPRKNIVNLWHR